MGLSPSEKADLVKRLAVEVEGRVNEDMRHFREIIAATSIRERRRAQRLFVATSTIVACSIVGMVWFALTLDGQNAELEGRIQEIEERLKNPEPNADLMERIQRIEERLDAVEKSVAARPERAGK